MPQSNINGYLFVACWLERMILSSTITLQVGINYHNICKESILYIFRNGKNTSACLVTAYYLDTLTLYLSVGVGYK